MQINLVPQSKEVEQQRKKISFFIVSAALLLLGAATAFSLILLSINLVNNNTISDLGKEIGNAKKDIGGYSKLEKNVTNFMTSVDGVKQILENRRRYDDLYSDIETLMPKETFLTEISTSDEEVTFKVRTTSPEKVAQFIESLRKYEKEPGQNESSEEQGKSAEEVTSSGGNQTNQGTESNIQKIKVFDSIEVTNYSKEEGYFQFDVKAKIREESWKKS